MNQFLLRELHFYGYYDGPLQGFIVGENSESAYFELAFASKTLEKRLYLLRYFTLSGSASSIDTELTNLFVKARSQPPTHFSAGETWRTGIPFAMQEIAETSSESCNECEVLSICDVRIVRSVAAVIRQLNGLVP